MEKFIQYLEWIGFKKLKFVRFPEHQWVFDGFLIYQQDGMLFLKASQVPITQIKKVGDIVDKLYYQPTVQSYIGCSRWTSQNRANANHIYTGIGPLCGKKYEHGANDIRKLPLLEITCARCKSKFLNARYKPDETIG